MTEISLRPAISKVKSVIVDETTGVSAGVNSTGQLKVVLDGRVDTDNSSSTPLLADAVFTGTAVDTLDYALFFVTIYSDVASATDGICVQISSDNITWRDGDCYTVPAGTEKTFSFQPNKKYMRVKYTNGVANQTTFDLHTVLKKTNSKASSHRIQDAIIDEDDAELVKAVVTGKNPSGDFVNFQSTTAGNFKMSLEELENDVSVNSNTQLKTTTFDSAGNEGQSIIGVNYIAGNSGIDATTETLQTINYEHHEIHSGNHYNHCDYILNEGSGAITEFIFATPNTSVWSHLTFEVGASEGATIELYVAPSGIVGGTAVTPRNNNRNSANVSTVSLTRDPTSIVSDGVRASGYLAGGGRTSGFTKRESEFVLQQNQTYLLRITSLAVSNDIGWCAYWYEHTNKN